MNLPRSILDEDWYPKLHTKTPLTYFEARIDYLFFVTGPDVKVSELYKQLADRWGWFEEGTEHFVKNLDKEGFTNKYDPGEDSVSKRHKIATEVITIYNKIFEREIHLNEHRCSLINARIKEGRKQVPPIGITQFKAVFEFKKKDWVGTDWEKYLTIETLCAAKHFQVYLEAARQEFKNKKSQKATATEPGFLSTSLFKK
jgi:uncharacterized phage protein (TIGR02220 family)